MWKPLFALVGILGLAAPALAQNPCTTPSTNQTLAASGVNHFFAELPDHNATEPDGTLRTVSYQYGAWPATANPNAASPTQGPTTIPKTAFVAVAGFPGCYELTGGLPGLIPTATPMIAGLRAIGQTTAPNPNSAWSSSNPFSLASPRQTPAPPGQLRIRP